MHFHGEHKFGLIQSWTFYVLGDIIYEMKRMTSSGRQGINV